MKFGIKFGNERLITPSGLGIAGILIQKTNFKKRVNKMKSKENENPQIKNSDILLSYIGLLCQGKSDFEAILEMHEDKEFFQNALDINRIPSSAILRQRMNKMDNITRTIILEENINLLNATNIAITECFKDYIALDIDVSPFDNSNTKKEGVSYTYKGFNGYSPILAYLGEEGYIVNLELREGATHSQKDTDIFLKNTIGYAKKLTRTKILVRMDSGNDSSDNIKVCLKSETFCDFLIKRNLRSEKLESWSEIAQGNKEKGIGLYAEPRDGKKVYTGSVYRKIDGVENEVRIVYQIIERTIRADGQMLLFPELEVQTWWTSLELGEEDVINLYKAHGTSEQFHSEIKTDMDLERFPSGHFKTNALVLELAILAYNILRIIGQESLKNGDIINKKNVLRRRLRTVIQNLIFIASRVVLHARRAWLDLGQSNMWRFAFKRIYEKFT